jgi:hypothetical protein
VLPHWNDPRPLVDARGIPIIAPTPPHSLHAQDALDESSLRIAVANV